VRSWSKMEDNIKMYRILKKKLMKKKIELTGSKYDSVVEVF
jgi:hypothetical protein